MRVKICGITRARDAHEARAAGADLLGAVLVPGTPRAVDADAAAAATAEAGLPLVVVVADLSLAETVRAARRAGARGIQLHGREPPAFLAALREEGPWELWKVARARTPAEVVAAAREYAPVADALLLDRWHPRLLGGTGRVFRWELLERARADVPAGLGVGVAGGLAPDNVAEAVRRLRPDIVDVSSGVEARPREKDPDKLHAFVRAAKAALQTTTGTEDPR